MSDNFVKLILNQQKMKTLFYSISILFLSFFLKTTVHAQAMIDVETGAVFTGYNDVRIPSCQGTLSSLRYD